MIFGIITAPANATIDDTIRYADAAGKVFQDIPDTRFTFQITNPGSGFGGMVLKPWGVRKTPTKDYLPHGAAETWRHSRAFKCFRSCPRRFPARIIFRSVSSSLPPPDQERILEFAKQIFAQSDAGAHVSVRRHRYQDRSAASRRSFSITTRFGHGPRHAASRRRSLGQHRRQFRQPVQHGRPELQSDPADQASRSVESGTAEKYLRHRAEQPVGPTEHGRVDQAQNRRAFAQSHAAAQCRHHQRRSGRFGRCRV